MYPNMLSISAPERWSDARKAAGACREDPLSRFPPTFNYAHTEIARAGGGSSSIDYVIPYMYKSIYTLVITEIMIHVTAYIHVHTHTCSYLSICPLHRRCGTLGYTFLKPTGSTGSVRKSTYSLKSHSHDRQSRAIFTILSTYTIINKLVVFFCFHFLIQLT